MGSVCESASKPIPTTNNLETIPKDINVQIEENQKKNEPKLDSNNDNNTKCPKPKIYNPDLLISIEDNKIGKSVDSDAGVELMTKDEKFNFDLINNNQSQYINSGIDTSTQKPISEISKSISFFENKKNTTVHFDPKSKTGVNSVRQQFPKMLLQNGKNITSIRIIPFGNIILYKGLYNPKKIP